MIVKLVVVNHLSNAEVEEVIRVTSKAKIVREDLQSHSFADTHFTAKHEVFAQLILFVFKESFEKRTLVEVVEE